MLQYCEVYPDCCSTDIDSIVPPNLQKLLNLADGPISPICSSDYRRFCQNPNCCLDQ